MKRSGPSTPSTRVLRSTRLVLRPFTVADAAHVRRLADDPDIARNTLSIPHPYPEGHAEAWIASVAGDVSEGRSAVFAVCTIGSGELVGAIGLHIDRRHQRGELGYWIGRAWRGRGLATEAARAVLDLAFGALGLERVYAAHFPWNPASGRVMAKLDMRYEGTLRGHVLKDGERVDEAFYGILREEHLAVRRAG